MLTREWTATVAECLGADWTPGMDCNDNPELTRADGLRLWMRCPAAWNKKDRIAIHGDSNAAGKGAHQVYIPENIRALGTEITGAADCAPERAAKEITRRLLPEWEQRFAYLKVRVAEDVAYKARRVATAEEAARACNGTVRDDEYIYATGLGRMTASGDGTITIDRVTVPVGKLAALVALIR